jgi:PleD family two-component response regulator
MTATQTSRTAVVVTNNPERDALDVIIESSDIDVALFESPANAYTRIKREKPSLVIVDLSFDSFTEFALLTLLKLDRDTAGIPIWTGPLCSSASSSRTS